MANELTQLTPEQQFLFDLEAAPASTPTGTPPPLPPAKVKVGDKEYSLEDLARLMEAQDAELQRLKKLQNLPEPESHEPARPEPQARPQDTTKPARWNAQTWAEKTASDPVAAQDIALGQALGLPEGASLSAAFKELVGVVGNLQSQLAGQTEKTQREILQREGERFLEQNKDYEANPENAVILERYLKAAGAAPTATGYTMAYKAAVTDGLIKPRGKQATQSQEPRPDPQASQTRLPSLRNSQNAANDGAVDWHDVKSKLDKMPDGQWEDYIAKYERGMRGK